MSAVVQACKTTQPVCGTCCTRLTQLAAAQVSVPQDWVDSLFPGVRRVLELVKARNARLQSGKRLADDQVSDKSAEGFLQTVLYSGICFWQNLPFRTQRYSFTCACMCSWPRAHSMTEASQYVEGIARICADQPPEICRYGLAYILHRLPAVAAIIVTEEYLHFAEQVMSSHDKANKQAELDVSASMGDMLTDMQACLKQLCGASAVGDAETVAKLIAEKVAAMNVCSDQADQDSQGEVSALPASPAAPQRCPVLPDRAHEIKRLKTNLIQAPALYDTTISVSTVSMAWGDWNSGPAGATIADKIRGIKADMSLAVAPGTAPCTRTGICLS